MLKFSFIIPVYNVDKYIGKCIDSILSQSYRNFEIILIDDGSTDRSGKICDEYKEKDNRIKVYHGKNTGLSGARNKGIELCEGEYIIFLDSDDYWVSDKLKILAEECNKNKVDILVYNYEIYDEKYKKITIPKGIKFNNVFKEVIDGQTYLEKVLEINPLYQWYAWSYAIKAKNIKELKFKVGIKYEDVDLMYKVILNANKIIVIDEIIIRYRLSRPGSITHDVKVQTEKDKLDVIKNCINTVNTLNIRLDLKRLLNNNFSCLYYSSLMLCNDIKSQEERKVLIHILKEYMWICEYTTNRGQKFIHLLIKVFGVNLVCLLLGVRKRVKSRM